MKKSHPLISSENKLKLAIFGLNVSSGCSMTDMPETLQVTWEESKEIALMAERIGIEAVIPVARWKGMGGKINFNHRNFEPLTWAAGLAAATSTIGIFATVHVPTVHPVCIAKEVATIDLISKGRFGLNIVAGWNTRELAMFGLNQRDHSDRYDCADEWISLCKEIWTQSDEFDFDGKYFQAAAVYSEPKPYQTPFPLLMSAGNSSRGQRYAAEHTDINFVVAPDSYAAGSIAKEVKLLAKSDFNKDISVYGQAYIVCRDTETEAKEYLDYYVNERGDQAGVENLLDILIPNSKSALDTGWRAMADNMIAGYGAIPLVGTPEQVVEGMRAFADNGIDGITLSWVDYKAGLSQFEKDILPLMRDAGLRQ